MVLHRKFTDFVSFTYLEDKVPRGVVTSCEIKEASLSHIEENHLEKPRKVTPAEPQQGPLWFNCHKIPMWLKKNNLFCLCLLFGTITATQKASSKTIFYQIFLKSALN